MHTSEAIVMVGLLMIIITYFVTEIRTRMYDEKIVYLKSYLKDMGLYYDKLDEFIDTRLRKAVNEIVDTEDYAILENRLGKKFMQSMR